MPLPRPLVALAPALLLPALGPGPRDEAAFRPGEHLTLTKSFAEDLSLELEAELLAMARLLVTSNVKSYVPSLPADTHPVDVRIRYTPRFGPQLRSA